MAGFETEHDKTAEKMANLVMEYVSQFIAQDYLEKYENPESNADGAFVPKEFDDAIYKKISDRAKKNTGYRFRIIRNIGIGLVTILCAACVGFTAFVISNEIFREFILKNF